GGPAWHGTRRLRCHRRGGSASALGSAGGRGGEERAQGVSGSRRLAAVARATPGAPGAPVIAPWSFYGALAVIAWVYVGYPVVRGIMAMLRRKPVARRSVEPPVSLIICAYNDERDIRPT